MNLHTGIKIVSNKVSCKELYVCSSSVGSIQILVLFMHILRRLYRFEPKLEVVVGQTQATLFSNADENVEFMKIVAGTSLVIHSSLQRILPMWLAVYHWLV
jgi:hypothetical protein